MALVVPNGEGPHPSLPGLTRQSIPFSQKDGPPKSGLPDFGILGAQAG
jgi:hypothetical protein